MRMQLRYSLEIGAILIFAPLFAERLVTETADFSGGSAPAGWTVANDAYVSPEYSNAVSRISLSCGASGTGQAGEAHLFAIGRADGVETQIASVFTAAAGAAFDFPVTSDFRKFRIAADGLALARFSATWLDARLDPPSNVVATALTEDSLEVSWDAVEGASGYKVTAWTNVVTGASAGSVVWEELMPGATNGESSARMSDDKFNNCFANAGWTRSDKAGYPTGENGTMRIGITGDSGWLQTPAIDVAGAGIAIRFQAMIGGANASPQMLVERISGDETNTVGEVTLTGELEEHVLAVPGWTSGDSIRFNSFASGDRRTVIGPVSLVAGCSAGTSSRVVVRELSLADGTSCTLDGLPQAIPVLVGVSAVDGDGLPSEMSAGVEVDLANPPPRATLNAWTVSSPAVAAYIQDFDFLSEATGSSGDKDFYNGVTIPFMQAWQDGDAISTISHYPGGNQTGARFLALATNIAESARAFGARTRQGTKMAWGVAFTNATGAAMFLTNVSYSAQQWGFANTTNQMLSCEHLVTNRLDWIVNFDEGWQTFAETEAQVLAAGEHGMPESVSVDYAPQTGIRIAPGEVLYVKWTLHPPAKGSSALMAIDDLKVAFNVQERGLLLRLAKNQAQAVAP